MIQYCTLCAIHQQYFQPYHTPMVSPLLFGRQHQYATRTTLLLAQPPIGIDWHFLKDSLDRKLFIGGMPFFLVATKENWRPSQKFVL